MRKFFSTPSYEFWKFDSNGKLKLASDGKWFLFTMFVTCIFLAGTVAGTSKAIEHIRFVDEKKYNFLFILFPSLFLVVLELAGMVYMLKHPPRHGLFNTNDELAISPPHPVTTLDHTSVAIPQIQSSH